MVEERLVDVRLKSENYLSLASSLGIGCCAIGDVRTLRKYLYLPRRSGVNPASEQTSSVATMPAGYACQRCLNSLRGNLTVARTSRNILPIQSRRWISTPSKQTSEATGHSKASRNAHQKRPLSLRSQGQFVRNEPGQTTTPRGLESTPFPEVTARELLLPNNLFHPFSESPSPDIRRRAAFIKLHAYCPHPSHHRTRTPTGPHDPEARKVATSLPPAHVRFECPDCGIPVSCSEEHWADDYESHLEICDTLREINEDDHDLRSGRFFPEFEYPTLQIEESMVNLTNWDTYLYTREHIAINEARSMRQVTRMLTYPVTIGSVLHELSPYNIRRGGRLTVEGLKSLSGKSTTIQEGKS